jgi:translation initiation factor IF-1
MNGCHRFGRAPMAAGNFRVKSIDTGKIVLARIAGRVARHHIRIAAGDQVMCELTPNDLTRARIVYRY